MTRHLARYAHDWEFLDTGHEIMPISVGIAAEDGRHYYAVFADVDMQAVAAHRFLTSEVVPYLPTYFDNRRGYTRIRLEDPTVKSPEQIRDEIHKFLVAPRKPVELWGYYAAHDHVLMAGQWGRMVDAPAGIPWFTRDTKSEAVRLGCDLPEQPTKLHHALADAEHIMHRQVPHLERVELARAADRQVTVDAR